MVFGARTPAQTAKGGWSQWARRPATPRPGLGHQGDPDTAGRFDLVEELVGPCCRTAKRSSLASGSGDPERRCVEPAGRRKFEARGTRLNRQPAGDLLVLPAESDRCARSVPKIRWQRSYVRPGDSWPCAVTTIGSTAPHRALGTPWVVTVGQLRVVIQREPRPARRAAHQALLAHAGHTCSGSGGLPENPRPRPNGNGLGTDVTPLHLVILTYALILMWSGSQRRWPAVASSGGHLFPGPAASRWGAMRTFLTYLGRPRPWRNSA
jgi:hypothetical protein